MAIYRDDSDLVFLKQCTNEDLELLVSILTVDPKDNTLRFTETLTSDASYKRHYPNHQLYWKSIAAELQTFGANSGMNLLRQGKGVCYREILIDVCNRTNTILSEPAPFFIEKIEDALLNSLLKQSLENISQKDLKKIAAELGNVNSKVTPSMVMMGIQNFMTSSSLISNYLIFSILNNLGFKSGNIMTVMFPRPYPRRYQELVVTICLAINHLWLLFNVTGPAYRVTIPACLYIATLRKKYNDAKITNHILKNNIDLKKMMGKYL